MTLSPDVESYIDERSKTTRTKRSSTNRIPQGSGPSVLQSRVAGHDVFPVMVITSNGSLHPPTRALRRYAVKRSLQSRWSEFANLLDTVGMHSDAESTLALSIVRLQGLYQLRGPEHIAEFLSVHKSLSSELEGAPAHIQEHFGDTPLALEVRQDEERPDQYYLAMLIMTTLRGREAFNRLDAIYRSWWSTKDIYTFTSLLIDVEFV